MTRSQMILRGIVLIFCLSLEGAECLVQSSYVGCYEDSAVDRKLDGYNITLSNMTTDICNYICFQKGFQFAAIQKKNQCFCGDYEDRQYPKPIDDSICKDSSSLSSSKLTLKVYRTGIDWSSVQNLEKKKIGCVSEWDPKFLVPRHRLDFSKTNSPKSCIAACTAMGFSHAGLSQSTVCNCGMAQKIEETTGCESPCPNKKSSENCGGFGKTSLYTTDAPQPDVNPLTVIEMGCFKNRPNGLLEYTEMSREEKRTMTPFKCVSICFRIGFVYAGLRNGDECQCGRMPSPSPEEVPKEFCDATPCAGVKNLTCGSPDYVKAFSTAIIGEHPLYGRSLGCFKNTGISFKEKYFSSESNNPVNCIAACLKNGFAFAAVQMNDCRCGNTRPKYIQLDMLPESSCNEPCSDGSMTCGGLSALHIFRTGLDFNAQDSCRKSETEVKGERVCSGKLVFTDNFESLDYNKWQRTVQISGEDYEFVTYSFEETLSYVKDGALHIKPAVITDDNFIRTGELDLVGCTSKGEECKRKAVSFNILPPIKSAQITTRNSFSFKYGVINIRAKLPKGDWIYPEIWLKPKMEAYGPNYWSGKIVVATAAGNENLTSSDGEHLYLSTVHSGILLGDSKTFKSKMISFKGLPRSEGFHNYTLIWSPESISMYVDDDKDNRKAIVEMKGNDKLSIDAGFSEKEVALWNTGTKAAPFDQEFYLTLGLGVGGYTNFPDHTLSKGKFKPWHNYQVKAMLNFWQAKEDWLSTWTSESELVVESISIHAL